MARGFPRNKEEAESFAARALEPWRLALLKNEKGAPKACLANALLAFRGAPEWHGILFFDAFHQRTLLHGQLPWSQQEEHRHWTPNDDTLAADWLQHEGIMINSKAAAEAVEATARDQTFHPVLDYLQELQWDGTNRLDEWAITYLGVEDTPYTRAVSSKWMISAIARVMQPGCKADCILILEGDQGIGKSQALRILFDPWFTDELSEMGTKDAAIQLSGEWCVELAELAGMRRNENERIKAFASRTFDRYRPPWGTRAIDQPRQTVFAGTANDSQYLRDETGGRRFWPMRCRGSIDLDGLRVVRDQLFAEARDRYEAGEAWWLQEATVIASATEEQDFRRVPDPWQASIAAWVVGKEAEGVLPSEYLAFLGMELVDQTQLDQNRVVACLVAIGWEKRPTRMPGVATPRHRYKPARS